MIGAAARRIRIYAWFPSWVILRGLFQSKNTVFVVPTAPFFLPGLAGCLFGWRGIRVIHLLHDLYPEILELANKIDRKSLGYRLLEWISRLNIRRSSASVFVGAQLKTFAESRYGRAAVSRIIPVGGDGEPFRGSYPTIPSELPFTVLYSGNFGHMHDTETLLRLFQDGGVGGIRFVINASGAGFNKLKSRMEADETALKSDVVWGEALESRDWVETMKSAHVGLVTMIDGAENVLFPSKTYSAMMAGQAILAICSKQSDLADLIQRFDCGWVVEPGDVKGLKSVLIEIRDGSASLLRRRQNAFSAGHQCFDMGVVARAWLSLLAELP